MNWTSYRPVQFNGQSYGQKDQELRRFLDLPRAVEPIQLELALAAGRTDRAPYDLLRRHGWRLADPDVVCADIEAYARYIKGSRGEWSVAKNAYVVGAPGWFSCRSACYLAAGRPVVVQDTGFPEVIPTGLGVVAFEDAATAAQGVRDVDGDWARHSTAARELAAEYFDARRVLARLLDEAFAERSATAVSEAS
jgi:glycosyltransferase involved in cell wall biosynthesis